MHQQLKYAVTKVPEVTVAFWIIKILATTLGETGGDAVTMSMDLGRPGRAFRAQGLISRLRSMPGKSASRATSNWFQ